MMEPMATEVVAAEFAALRRLSARIGGNPSLVQGAGGNTSIKQDGILWIKASGTWLMNAERDDIMVPVEIEPLLDAVASRRAEAEKAQEFVVAERNATGLRPSIETTVHALMPQRVVVHVHCVETIACAVQIGPEIFLEERLRGLNWVFVPYRRPGLPLAQGISERLRHGTDVLVLGNHGLVVAAETVGEAETLLIRVSGLLARPVRRAPQPDLPALQRLAAGSNYRLPAFPESHAVAADLASCRIAAGGSLYPDHVIFLGAGSVIAGPAEDATAIASGFRGEGRDAPVSILFPGKGVLMRRDASAGAEAMARCLADVTSRIEEGALLRHLTEEEDGALLNWDAEKYRQELNRQHTSRR
jgi:rhamnose utilization protein RhaD (predicted bifunctional aldolase and dehydrogenase)